MSLAPETARLSALRSYGILDTPPEPELDDLAAAAARVCRTPVGLLSLVDRDRQYFKARFGTDVVEAPREASFCAHAITATRLFEVSDAKRDPRFREHPMVCGAPGIRFYAGMPLVTPARAAIGTLCVLDWRPRKLEPSQRDALETLAQLVVVSLERRKLETARLRARDALEQEVATRLRRVQGRLVSLDLDPGKIFSLLQDTEIAAQLVDDAVDLLNLGTRAALRRRASDLATICRSLIAALGDPRITLKVEGDCSGCWDEDRLSVALAAFFEQAHENAVGTPVQIDVDGTEQAVTISIHVRLWRIAGDPGSALRVALACAVLEAHGGSFEVRSGPVGALAVVSLPKS